MSSTIHETDDDRARENCHARNNRLRVFLPGLVLVSRVADKTDLSIATVTNTQTLPQPPSLVSSDQRTLVNAAKARML